LTKVIQKVVFYKEGDWVKIRRRGHRLNQSIYLYLYALFGFNNHEEKN
jgi:hypothetical protein